MTSGFGQRGGGVGRLSPSELYGAAFRRTALGRRGYDEQQVDRFVERVKAEFTQLTAEKAELRDQLERLRRRIMASGDVAEQQSGPQLDEAQIQAVRLLAQAQQTADQYVAGAEDYSRRIAADARAQYDELLADARLRATSMLDDAHRRAAEAAEAAAEAYRRSPGEYQQEKEELERQVAYLQTFSKVCRTQLRAFLEALIRDVEEEWERMDMPAPRPPTGSAVR